MPPGAPRSFGAQLRALRETAGYTQEELATIAGLSVHAVSALERGERRRPHVETVRALCAALDLTGTARDAFVGSARADADTAAVEELSGAALPVAPTTLLGRDADVEALRQCLADPAGRLITLTGPGGVGKTRVALAIAHAMAAGGTSRVVFVPLAPIRTAALVAPAIADALGFSNVSAVDLPKRTRIACADRPTLLVLDNFEHVIAAAPLVAELLTSVASLRVLVTSRALLHVRGEREYALGPLALDGGAAAVSPADLARMPAVRLFVERVRDVQPEFRFTAANGPTVTAICRRLDALPLALELAAPWMRVLTAEDLLRRLDHDALFSSVGPRDLPERQQTMNATVAWSYQLLGVGEQRAFRRLGALRGRFPIEAAAAILAGREAGPPTSDEALGAIAILIDKSLLLRADTSAGTRPLYQMLETVRAFAELELTASDEREDALVGLARYCVGEASLAVDGLMGRAQTEWLDRVRDDLENYRGALTWLIERGRTTDASAIAWGLLWFWAIRGHAVEGLRWYEQILSLSSLASDAESRARLGAAGMRYIQGDFEGARADLTRAQALARRSGDLGSVVHAEFVLGHVAYATGDLDAAGDHFTRSVEGFSSAGHAWGTGQGLAAMAWVALAKGHGGEAERLVDAAVAALRHAGPWSLLLGLYIRAILLVQRGSPDAALAVARESLTHIRNLQDKWNFIYTLVPLAAAAALKGDHAWVARILGARDAVMEATGARVVDASVRDLHEAVEREARQRLGPDRWRAAYAAGRKTSIDALLKDIDAVVHRPGFGAA